MPRESSSAPAKGPSYFVLQLLSESDEEDCVNTVRDIYLPNFI